MKRILVVEDNRQVAQYICDIFSVKGFDVQLTYDGVEGWEALQDTLPDVIISDVDMPDMDGYELLQRVRGNESTATLPFILLTGRTERDDQRQGMTLGADDFVTKPFTPTEILASVETMIGKQELFLKKHETSMSLLRKNITYVLPHELRTPLQAIIGYANLMQMDFKSLSPAEIKEYADNIFESGMRLQRIAENTLTYAQIEIIASDPKQKQQLRNNILREPTEVIEEAALKIAARHNRESDLKLELKPKVLRISADNLNQIIEALVDNAFKFSKSGKPVRIRSLASDNAYLMIIEDRGRGMTTDQIDRIGAYMQFERVVYEQQGMGMGLIIAKRLIELHGGLFSIKSKTDKGTAIIVKLPN